MFSSVFQVSVSYDSEEAEHERWALLLRMPSGTDEEITAFVLRYSISDPSQSVPLSLVLAKPSVCCPKRSLAGSPQRDVARACGSGRVQSGKVPRGPGSFTGMCGW